MLVSLTLFLRVQNHKTVQMTNLMVPGVIRVNKIDQIATISVLS